MKCREALQILFGAALALMADPLSAVLVPVVSPPVWTEMQPMTDEVTWGLKPRSVLVDGGSAANLRLRCGQYGVFDLSIEETATAARQTRLGGTLTPCAGVACGSEHPALYPSLYPFNLLDATPVAEGMEENPAKAETPAKASQWVPCADGSCFASIGLSGYVPSRPWIAVLDWHNLHGWSVGWTILGIADPAQHEAVLLPLDEARLIPFSRTGATDVHVLAQLCSILEEVDMRGIAPPAVINMSFGRRFRDDDGESAATCDRAMLSCQIARVLGRLVGDGASSAEAETIAVASSGNDRRALFPAGLEAVLPAGSLQLGQYGATGQAVPSWETPSYAPRTQALMPGYGLCIGERIGTESGNEWAAPAGTSYAAAVFSGWLAETLARMAVYAPLDTRPWFPTRTCNANRTSCTYSLTHGTTTYGTNPRINALFLQLFHPRRPCGTPPQVSAHQILKLTSLPASEGDLPADSFLDVFADFKLPAPPSTPCIPCRGMTSIDGGLSSTGGGLSTGGAKASLAGFSVDLSGISTLSPPFPPALSSQMNVEGLFLRIGDLAFLRLVPAAGSQLDFSMLESGLVRRISVSGVPDLIQGSAQPSLLFILRPTQPDLTDRPFWVSIPILIGK